MGKLRNPEKFDNVFFGIHRKMAESLDVLTRLCLERSIEAIVDAGEIFTAQNTNLYILRHACYT